MPSYKGKFLSMSTQDMRILLNQLDIMTKDRYTQKIVEDAIDLKIIKLDPSKFEGWDWVRGKRR